MQANIHKSIEKYLSDHLGSEVKISSSDNLGGGCINHATKATTNQGVYFVKWNNHGPEDMFLREAESLEALGASGTSLIIPRVFVKKARSKKEPALLITDYLEAPNDRSSQDEALGRGLAELHNFQFEKFGFDHDNYCGSTLQNNQWNDNWISFFGKQRIMFLVHAIEEAGKWGVSETKVYEQLIHRLPSLIGHQPKPSLNHGDLWSGNYMYTSRGPALIDPASYYADREFDLALMAMFGGFSQKVWDAYQEMSPLPAEWKERRDLYMLYHYLNHYFLFGGGYGQQAMNIAKSYL